MKTPDTIYTLVPLEQIVASPTQPRKSFDPITLAELAKNIKASGVHTPILLRPLPADRVSETAWMIPRPTHELISGERRYRASELADAPFIPAITRALTDDQVLEIQITENLQREDLLPLEEAEGYELLRSRHEPPLSADQIAAIIGKSRSYVYGRLKLLDLGPEGRTAMREGWLDASRALIIARIPDGKVQAQALGNIRDTAGDVLSVRAAADLIQRQYMLRLDTAKFKISDATLIESAGACQSCHKRTGADPDLFAGPKGADLCTDTACFKAKEQQHKDNQLKAARASGATIIEGREAKSLMPHGFDERVEGYLRLDDNRDAPGGKKPLRDLIGEQMASEGIAPTLVENPHKDGELIAVIDHATASRLLAKKGHQEQAEALDAKASQSAKDAAEAEQQKAKDRFENAWRWQIMVATWEALKAIGQDPYILPVATIKHLATTLIPNNAEKCKKLCKLLDLGTVAPSAALRDWIRENTEPDRALALLVMHSDLEYRTWGEPETQTNQALIDVATGPGVGLDIEAIKAKVQAEHTADLKAHRKAKAKAAEAPTGTDSTDPTTSGLFDPAAPLLGGGGASRQSAYGANTKTRKPTATRSTPKMHADEAMKGIAEAMQQAEAGGDFAPSDTDSAGASAGGVEGRATSPDASATPTTTTSTIDPDLIEEARRAVVRDQIASISHIRRTIKGGYKRAVEVLDALQALGVVSATDKDGQRRVIEKQA